MYLPHSYFVTDHKQAWREDENAGVVPGGAPLRTSLPADSPEAAWALEEHKRWQMRKQMFPHIRDDTVIFANWNQLYKVRLARSLPSSRTRARPDTGPVSPPRTADRPLHLPHLALDPDAAPQLDPVAAALPRTRRGSPQGDGRALGGAGGRRPGRLHRRCQQERARHARPHRGPVPRHDRGAPLPAVTPAPRFKASRD